MNKYNSFPNLRPLDFQPVTYQNQPMWLLRDPLKLSSQQLIFPAPLAQMLMFVDGTRTPAEIHRVFCRQIGAEIDFEIVASTLERLDAACLLDNTRARAVQRDLLAAYHAQPHRPPALADLSYPANPTDLSQLFDHFSVGDDLSDWQPWRGRGIVSPHIDYQRGGPVYAKVWRRAETAVLNADLVIIFGTDHNGGPGTITLTRQPYATPYGVLPADLRLVDKLANVVGPEFAFAEELHHREEHSIELSAVWLHYIYQRAGIAPKPMVPILVGSFFHFLQNGHHPAQDERLTAVIKILQSEAQQRNVLMVSSVDLAHVGPNFGDEFHMDAGRRAALKVQDDVLMETAVRGDARNWYAQIAGVQDRNRICGFAPTYLMLRCLGSTHGQKIAYDQCPADAAGRIAGFNMRLID